MNEPTLVMGESERKQAQRLSERKLRPPTRVPGYQDEQFLGKGAFGEVWMAQDSNTGRRVAIKFYSHRGGLDWSLLSREVEKLRFLFNDRHVVQLLEVGWEADPPHYIMEYLERGSLEELLKRDGSLPVREAVALIREVATGLIHAHGKGILHCDVKPANILLDQDGRARLADFGQSRLSHEQSPALGTLFYMAPEQADLKAAPDARWDVYALGAVFFHLLTGQAPYRQARQATEILQGASLEQRLERYRNLISDSLLPKEHRQVPGVNRALAGIIDRCLAGNPRNRFANVQAVLDALDAWANKQARRPLLILGALGPALIFLVLAGFAWRGLNMTVDDSREALTARSLESNYFAARFVADQFALDVDKRWRILEHEASDNLLREHLDRIRSQPVTSQEYLQQQAWLQKWVEQGFARLRSQFRPGTEAQSWFVTDRRGLQVARAPFVARTINKNWSKRDYFHGQGLVLHDAQKTPEPIRKPHRSVVFRSRATKSLMVAFSVPIWEPGTGKKGEPVGVLCMTVELGNFLEMTGTQKQFAVLIDTRRDAEKKRPGLIVEHPYLDAQKKGHSGIPVYYAEKEVLARASGLQQNRVKEIRGHFEKAQEAEDFQEFTHEHFPVQDFPGNYQDPVPGYGSREWLATMEPVILAHGPHDIRDTGWIVVVQKDYQETLTPVNALQTRLFHLGLGALAIVMVVVTGLWVFVIFVLNEGRASRLTRALRRHAGLPGSGSSVFPASPLPSNSAVAPTVIEDVKKAIAE